MSGPQIISQQQQDASAPFLQNTSPTKSNTSYFLTTNSQPKSANSHPPPSFWSKYKNQVKLFAVVAAILTLILSCFYFFGVTSENKKRYVVSADDDSPPRSPNRNFDGGNKSGDDEDERETGNVLVLGQKPVNTQENREILRNINAEILENEAKYDTYLEGTCSTKECKEAIALITSSLDYSYLPCDDFYKFACGGWIKDQTKKLEAKRNSNTSTITVLSALDELNIKRIAKLIENIKPGTQFLRTVLGKIKRFYNSCINQKNLQFLVDILKAPENSAKKQFSNEIPDFRDGKITLEELDFISRELENNTVLGDYYNYRRDFDSETKSALCVEFTRELIPEGVAKLFVISHYNIVQDDSVNQLLDKLWETYRSMILLDTPWITDINSKLNLTNAIASMTIVSGYPAEIFNSTYVEGKYSNAIIDDNFLLNLKELVRLRVERKDKGGFLEQLFLEFFKDTTQATAFYMKMLDTTLIPAGILQIPVFHHSFPDILKFAKLGSKAAHEFAHSLSAYMEGIVLESKLIEDPFIFAESAVSPSTKQSYLNKTQCVQNQYNLFEVPLSESSGPLLHINGTLTKKENVADIIGLQIAFTSFMENAANSFQPLTGLSDEFSMEQIFFIAHAQNYCQAFIDFESEITVLKNQVKTDLHAPNAIRVLGSFGNFEEFSKAFKCPIGSKYNPKRKCGFFEN